MVVLAGMLTIIAFASQTFVLLVFALALVFIPGLEAVDSIT
jgi:hypothetical protein